jgi:hypothetical protein
LAADAERPRHLSHGSAIEGKSLEQAGRTGSRGSSVQGSVACRHRSDIKNAKEGTILVKHHEAEVLEHAHVVPCGGIGDRGGPGEIGNPRSGTSASRLQKPRPGS